MSAVSTPVSPATSSTCLVCGGSSESMGKKGSYSFYRCGSCGLLFVWPLPSDTLNIYSESYFAGAEDGFGYVDYDQDKAPMTGTFEQYLDLLAQHHPNQGGLLDVGAATGFFLDLARRRQWRTFGVEPSDYAARVARQKGLDVHCGVLEDLAMPDPSLDVITMWDVIEHVPDPRRSLAKSFAMLAPGGTLAINTPDASSLLARLLGLRWHLVVPPEHLVLFSRRSLELLLKEAGFEVILVRRIGKRFTVQYVLETLARWQRLRLWHFALDLARRSGVGDWGVSINLYDNMFILARKPL